MQVPARFTIAIHILACIDTFGEDHKITSNFLADSVNANPVVIRRILGQLKTAEIIDVTRGSGGAVITSDLATLTYLDVFTALECIDENKLFAVHKSTNEECPVASNIHQVMDIQLDKVQQEFMDSLQKISVLDTIRDTQNLINKQK